MHDALIFGKKQRLLPGIHLVICFILVLIIFPFISVGQCENARNIIKRMNKYHVCPSKVDDRFSEEWYRGILQTLDPMGMILTKQDTLELGKFRFFLDDEINSGDCRFCKLATQVYTKSLERVDSILNNIEKNGHFQDTAGELFCVRDSVIYAGNSQELYKKWQAFILFETLLKTAVEDSNSRKSEPESEKFKEKLGNIIHRHKIRNQSLRERPGGNQKWIEDIYLNKLTATYDPHSSFFSPGKMNRWRNITSNEDYSFGFVLGENTAGETIIEFLVPGGAAWNSDCVAKGDVVLAVRQNKNETDISTMDIDEAERVLGEIGNNTVEFVLRKSDGSQKTCVLKKEKTKSLENSIYAFVISGSHKIGYISLPGFYISEYSHYETGLGCSNDLAKEILKLRKDSIEGLIIDIRDNGGGSLYEAVSLSGIFIEAGPMVIIEQKDQKPFTLKDMNIGTVYDGPMAIMINRGSASASELFAAAMQDYRRAIIVGTPSFGKASGQEVMVLDSSVRNSALCDYVKITNFRFYRITGKSHQWRGVIPDIELPSTENESYLCESKLPHALKPDSINKKTYYTLCDSIPIYELKQKSFCRTGFKEKQNKAEAYYRSLAEFTQKYKMIKLRYQDVSKYLDDYLQLEYMQVSVYHDSINQLLIKPGTEDADILKLDPFRQKIFSNMISDICIDFQVIETYKIIGDWIDLKRKIPEK